MLELCASCLQPKNTPKSIGFQGAVLCCACSSVHIVCIHSTFAPLCGYTRKLLLFLSVTLNHPSSLRIQTTWLHGPSILAVRLPLSLLPNINPSGFTEISWCTFLIYMSLCSSDCLIPHYVLMKSSESAASCQTWLFQWFVHRVFMSVFPQKRFEWYLSVALCRCSWWQPWFPANFWPMFRQPVWQPQRVHCLQRSPWGAKPRKSYYLNCLLLLSVVTYSV